MSQHFVLVTGEGAGQCEGTVQVDHREAWHQEVSHGPWLVHGSWTDLPVGSQVQEQLPIDSCTAMQLMPHAYLPDQSLHYLQACLHGKELLFNWS